MYYIQWMKFPASLFLKRIFLNSICASVSRVLLRDLFPVCRYVSPFFYIFVYLVLRVTSENFSSVNTWLGSPSQGQQIFTGADNIVLVFTLRIVRYPTSGPAITVLSTDCHCLSQCLVFDFTFDWLV